MPALSLAYVLTFVGPDMETSPADLNFSVDMQGTMFSQAIDN